MSLGDKYGLNRLARWLYLGSVFLLFSCRNDGKEQTSFAPLPSEVELDHAAQIKYITKALEKDPQNDYYLYQRSLANLAAGRENQALRDIRSATARLSDIPPKYLMQESKVLYELGREEEALEVAEKAQGAGMQSVKFNAFLGQLYFLNDQPLDAVPLLRQSVAILPNEPGLAYSLGAIYASRADTALASQYLAQAIAIAPSDPSPYTQLMEAYLATGDVGKAAKIGSNFPDDAEASAEMAILVGKTLQQLNLPDSAMTWFTKATKLDAGQWQPFYELGMDHLKKRKYQASSENLKKAVALNTDLHKTSYQIGIIEEYQLDRLNEALKYYQQASQSDSLNTDYQRAIRRTKGKIEFRKRYPNGRPSSSE